MTITVYPPYGSSVNNAFYAQFGGSTVDAFGRLRVTSPYTLFDSQSRFAADPAYSYVTATGGTTTYNTNKSSVDLAVTTSSGNGSGTDVSCLSVSAGEGPADASDVYNGCG